MIYFSVSILATKILAFIGLKNLCSIFIFQAYLFGYTILVLSFLYFLLASVISNRNFIVIFNSDHSLKQSAFYSSGFRNPLLPMVSSSLIVVCPCREQNSISHVKQGPVSGNDASS